MSFFETLITQPFLQYAFIAGLFASFIAGTVGTLISLKNMTSVSGGLSHSVFGGIGIAYFLETNEYVGALLFAIIAAVVMSYFHFRARENESVLINALWAVGMALGILFMYLTPGYSTDLSSYIFGSLILISFEDLVLIGTLTIFIAIMLFLFYRLFLAYAFDPEQVYLKGIKTPIIYTLLLIIVALSVVILLRITGLILLIAILTLPAAIARLWSDSIPMIILLAFGICLVSIYAGFYLSFQLELPPGAVMVLFLGVFYFVALGVGKIKD